MRERLLQRFFLDMWKGTAAFLFVLAWGWVPSDKEVIMVADCVPMSPRVTWEVKGIHSQSQVHESGMSNISQGKGCEWERLSMRKWPQRPLNRSQRH